VAISTKTKHQMKIRWKTRVSFYSYKYATGPLIDIIVSFFQGFFVLFDKITENEAPPLSKEEALQEYRNRTNLSVNNLPVEFQSLLPLAIKWGIGDDAIREDVTKAATEIEIHQLISALDGKLGAIDRWIDSFPEDSISDEAAAFMYMSQAIEELGLDVKYE
jgi:hypothetical protein